MTVLILLKLQIRNIFKSLLSPTGCVVQADNSFMGTSPVNLMAFRSEQLNVSV